MKEQKRARVRHQILRHAARLFARYGIDPVTVDRIARSSALSRTAIYYYFSSKEEILKALWQRGWYLLYRAVAPYEALSEEDPMLALTQAIKQQYALFRRHRALLKTLFRLSTHRDRQLFETEKAHNYRQKYLHFHRKVLMNGMERGDFRRLEPAVAMRAIHGIIIGFLTLPDRSQKQSIDTEILTDIVRRFLT